MDPSMSGHDAALHHEHNNNTNTNNTTNPSSSGSTGSSNSIHQHQHHQHASLKWQHSDITDSATSSSQHTVPQSIANSQESNYTSSSDHAIASPASDHSSAADNTTTLPDPVARADECRDGSDRVNHLLHLSTIAAAQDRISLDAGPTSRGPRLHGEMRDSASGVPRNLSRGHARNMSAVSVASTSGSTIGELSAELKTRLSYAMVKVNLGLQTHSIEEVECLASQAASASPAPGVGGAGACASTLRGRQASSVSPDLALGPASSQGHFAQDARIQRRKSESPLPNAFTNKSSLAPPASIQATLSTPAARLHPRRNSTPRHAALLHSHSSAPHTPGYAVAHEAHHQFSSQPVRAPDSLYYASQTRNAREQDAVETLLFMSSPNNSANMKHAFSPLASPELSQLSAKSSSGARPGPSGAPRKSLPTHRPAAAVHKKSSGLLHPSDSPMALDSPQHSYYSPNRVTPRRRVRGNSTHLRSSLSLPVALGGGHSGARRVLRDEDIERMLDRVAAETADSSDDEDIQIPRLKNDVAGVMGIRG
ncbi:hypothetical protein ESCO_003694 [Escovopsis weberi]|uniref:Uncharacterized protein n=1 Tax=Escovopsis weberi TaxID=150374 RepID=A0A0M8N488_ESCWE|nr:hypothetical protein ESCO_003694 [Escovopsis weberi]